MRRSSEDSLGRSTQQRSSIASSIEYSESSAFTVHSSIGGCQEDSDSDDEGSGRRRMRPAYRSVDAAGAEADDDAADDFDDVDLAMDEVTYRSCRADEEGCRQPAGAFDSDDDAMRCPPPGFDDDDCSLPPMDTKRLLCDPAALETLRSVNAALAALAGASGSIASAEATASSSAIETQLSALAWLAVCV